jgi:hypothetical protein
MQLDNLRQSAKSILESDSTNSRVAGSTFRKSRVRAFAKSWFWVVLLGTDRIESYRHSGTPVMAPAPSLPSPATIRSYLSPQSALIPSSASSLMKKRNKK